MHTVVPGEGDSWTVVYEYPDKNGDPQWSQLRNFPTQGQAADYCSWLNGGSMPDWGVPLEALDRHCRTCIFWAAPASARNSSTKMWRCKKRAPRGELVQGTQQTVWAMTWGHEDCGDWRQAAA